MNYLQEIIELRESLEKLLVKGPDGRDDFNELGRLLVYRVAYAMGMSYDEAKEALMGITGLSVKELEERVKKIEEELEKLEKKIELIRQEKLAGVVTADVGEFAKGGIYPNIKVENGELRVRVEDGYHSIVRAGKFNELIDEVRDRLLKQGFAVVVGPKGIGKSTLAAAEIWELFLNGDIGLVARVDALNKKNYSEFTTFIENYGEKFSEHFGRLLILYDPVSTKAYERADIDMEAHIQANIEMTIEVLMKAIKSISSEAPKPLALIVIPSDVYNTLSEERRNELEGYKLDVSQRLINTEFLAELIREYTRTKSNPNGCALSDRELSELAGELVKFDSGHALIARLIGEELARNNCSAREIKELISKAEGKAEAFIILHINGLFKVHKNTNTAKALVEIFALRRPFVDLLRPGVPILTQGIIGLIGEKKGSSMLQSAEGGELRGWLVIRQHDLIEEAIKKLLKCIVSGGEECKELGIALEPWKIKGVRESLMVVSEKVRDVRTAVEYFVGNYGEKLTNTLKVFSNECWKRAALIIGYALPGFPIVPRPEDLRIEVIKSLGNALNRCGLDDYLLVGNVIPLFIMMVLAYTLAFALAWAFIDRHNEAVAEVNRILNIARGRGSIYEAEIFYGLGLVSIIANAARLGRDVKPNDADAALRIASSTIQYVASLDLIKSVLGALEPLRDKAPHRYLELLVSASDMENLNPITVRYIFAKLNEILDNYGDVVRGYAWSLVYAIRAYAVLLRKHFGHFNSKEVGDMVGRVVDLLNELGRFKTSLDVFARAYALPPALVHEYVRRLMEEKLGIDVVGKASEVLEELSRLRGLVQDLMRDEEFMSYIESRFVKADEEAVKKEILEAASYLKQDLAIYRLDNNELDEAKKLFNEAAEERREIGDYINDLVNRNWALRVEAIKGSLVGEKLVNEFRRLYEETFNVKHFKLTARYLSIASSILSNYLVSLALMGDHETINKLLEGHFRVLNANKNFSVLTRLMLNVLLRPRVGLSSELKGKLSVNPEELIDAFGYIMSRNFLPALRVAFKMISPEDGYEECKSIEDSMIRRDCEGAVLGVMDDRDAIWRIRGALINYFNKRILEIERSGWLRELGFDANALISEFGKLVSGLDGKSLAQLLAIYSSTAHLALMLHALINGNKELAKALALYGAIYGSSKKLLTRLFLEVYKECKECCDLENESFRRAIARLFFLHV
jgi:tetratricopeptide (TPR) repeat protein